MRRKSNGSHVYKSPWLLIFLGSLGTAIAITQQHFEIVGLTVRVNLLEARIHWQEAPPEKATSDKILLPDGCIDSKTDGIITDQAEQGCDTTISGKASYDPGTPTHPIR